MHLYNLPKTHKSKSCFTGIPPNNYSSVFFLQVFCRTALRSKVGCCVYVRNYSEARACREVSELTAIPDALHRHRWVLNWERWEWWACGEHEPVHTWVLPSALGNLITSGQLRQSVHTWHCNTSHHVWPFATRISTRATRNI